MISTVSKRKQLLVLLVLLVVSTSVLLASLEVEVAILSMLYVIPVLLAIAFAIVSWSRIPAKRVSNSKRSISNVRFCLIVVAFVSLQILSIAIRVESRERDLLYFGVEGASVILIVLQAVAVEPLTPRKSGLLLSEIGLLASLQILMKTFPLPYYFSNTDVAYHEHWVAVIAGTGHIGQFMGPYYNFPALHVLGSMIYQVASLFTPLQSVFVIFVIIGFIMPFLFFSIIIKVTRDSRLALLASILCPLGYLFIDFLSTGVPYALSFALFGFLVLICTGAENNRRYLWLGLLVATTIVFTHQISIAVGIVVLLVYLFVLRYYWMAGSDRHSQSGFPVILYLIAIYGAYTVLNVYVFGFYGDILARFEATTDVSMPALTPRLAIEGGIQYYFFRHFPFGILLFFAFMGLLVFIGYYYPFKPSRNRWRIGALGVIALAFYVPGITSIIRIVDEFVAGGTRNSMFAEPLVLSFAALAISRARANRTIWGRFALTLLVSVMIIGAITSETNTEDTFALGHKGVKGSAFFTEEDLQGLSFLQTHTNTTGGAVWSDFAVSRFLEAHGARTVFPNLLDNGTLGIPSESIVFLRVNALQSNGLYFYQHAESMLVAKFEALYPSDTSSFRETNGVVCDTGGNIVVICYHDSWIGVSAG